MTQQFLVLRVDDCQDKSQVRRLLFQGVSANTWFSTRGITQTPGTSASTLTTSPTPSISTATAPRINPQIVRALETRARHHQQYECLS